MEIALTAEGTYPHHFGGVSVWCDQLIRGMPDYDFALVALVATGAEPVRWKLPANVVSLDTVPVWGPAPGVSARTRMGRSASSPPVQELVDVLLAPPARAQDRFADVMREMFECAQDGSLSAALASESSVRLLSRAWRDRPESAHAVPTLHDAVTVMQLLEHSLRPLAHPPVRADVVHAVTNGLGALPALAARWRHGTPMVVTEHGIYMREQFLHSRKGPYRWPVRRLYMRFLRRLCALGYHEAQMITPGNIYNKRWEEQLGADLSKVRTVYNGVDPADFPALDSEPGVPTISWAGRVDPVKDLETLLRAFCLVRRQMPDARLRIFGSPPPGGEAYAERCRALAAELGISDATAFEGRVDNIRDAYAAGQIVVLCSITEGFPYTLIEAMTCGRPCVGTDVGGVTEAIGDTGLAVPPRSPDALAQACLRLLRDAGLRQRMGAAARLRALEFFTVDRAISAYDEIYTFLGTGRPMPAAEPAGLAAGPPQIPGTPHQVPAGPARASCREPRGAGLRALEAAG